MTAFSTVTCFCSFAYIKGLFPWLCKFCPFILCYISVKQVTLFLKWKKKHWRILKNSSIVFCYFASIPFCSDYFCVEWVLHCLRSCIFDYEVSSCFRGITPNAFCCWCRLSGPFWKKIRKKISRHFCTIKSNHWMR